MISCSPPGKISQDTALPRGKEFDTQQQMEMMNQINSMRIDTLESLIERCMLFQEAKRHIKDPKVLARVYEEADRIWHDNEILPLEREYNVDNEQQLSERLASRGRSLEAMRQSLPPVVRLPEFPPRKTQRPRQCRAA